MALNESSLNSVGASGAIMGGLAGAFVLTFRDSPGSARTNRLFGLARLLIPALLPRAAGLHVDAAAHLGGALGGAAVAVVILLIWTRESPQPPVRKWAKAVPLIPLLLLPIGLRSGIATYELGRGIAAEAAGRMDEADQAFSTGIALVPSFTDSCPERAVAVADRRPGWGHAPLLMQIARIHAGRRR